MTSPERSPFEEAPTDTLIDGGSINRDSVAFKAGKLAGRGLRAASEQYGKIMGYEQRQLPELSEADIETRDANVAEFERMAETARQAFRISTQTSPEIARISQSDHRFGGKIIEDYSELAGNTFREVAEALATRLQHDDTEIQDHGNGIVSVGRYGDDPLAGEGMSNLQKHAATLLSNKYLFGSDIKIINESTPIEASRTPALDTTELAMQLSEMVGILERDNKHPERPDSSLSWRMSKEQLHALVGLAEAGAEIARRDNDPEVIAAWREHFDRTGLSPDDIIAGSDS